MTGKMYAGESYMPTRNVAWMMKSQALVWGIGTTWTQGFAAQQC
jgi:hypothetical protein